MIFKVKLVLTEIDMDCVLRFGANIFLQIASFVMVDESYHTYLKF